MKIPFEEYIEERKEGRLEKYDDREGIEGMTEPIEVLMSLVPRKEWNCPDVNKAMEDELTKWIKYDTYSEVEDEGQERIDTTKEVNSKEDHDGLKVSIKARLCLRGYKETAHP